MSIIIAEPTGIGGAMGIAAMDSTADMGTATEPVAGSIPTAFVFAVGELPLGTAGLAPAVSIAANPHERQPDNFGETWRELSKVRPRVLVGTADNTYFVIKDQTPC